MSSYVSSITRFSDSVSRFKQTEEIIVGFQQQQQPPAAMSRSSGDTVQECNRAAASGGVDRTSGNHLEFKLN